MALWLRDRLVWCINDEKIQNRLLSETGLTYQKALSLAQRLETAGQNLKELQQKQGLEGSGVGTGYRQSNVLKVGQGRQSQRRRAPVTGVARRVTTRTMYLTLIPKPNP